MGNKKFRVGDRVRIKTGLVSANEYGNVYFASPMEKYLGKDAVIKYVVDKGYRLDIDDYAWKWSDEMLEPIKNETIVIYRNGNDVIALDKTTGKKGIAKCNPLDTFDFNIGAKLALERLTNDEILKKHDSTIRVGDIVKIVNGGKSYTTYGDWVVKHVSNKNDICHYHYDFPPDNGMRGEVLHVADHGTNGKTLAYVKIRGLFDYKCYLIGVDGLKKI